MGIDISHIDQGFETLTGGARPSRLDGKIPHASFYDPELISESTVDLQRLTAYQKYRWWQKF